MLHSQIREKLKNSSTINWDNVNVARETFLTQRKLFKEVQVEVASVIDRTISYNNISIPIRIYTPKGCGPFPLLVYFHGGGFVLGDLNSVDNLCRYLCKHSDHIVISVDYRLAPEHPYPAAIQDALGSIQWANDYANDINGINTDIAIAGDSAGGNLAAQVAILLRDSEQVSIESQWLFYPWLDFNLNSSSHQLYGEGYNLTTTELQWYMSFYLPPNIKRNSSNVSPLFHENLSFLPDTVILTAQYDPLQEDGMKYAKALIEAGNSVDYRCCKNLTHSFLNMTGEVDEAKDILDEIAAKLRVRNNRTFL